MQFIDESGRFTKKELRQLSTFLIEECHTTTRDIEWLESVIIRDEKEADWLGKWQARFVEIDARRERLTTVIVLNSWALRSVESLKRTLAHEYGHNWTLGHLLTKRWLSRSFSERAPRPYYHIRRLNPKKFMKDYSKTWAYCDKEVLAEDYRCLLTPYARSHQMHKIVSKPSSEVKQYLVALGRPDWILI